MLEILKELAKSNLPVKEQIKIFIKKTGYSRRTFFKYRKKLCIRTSNKPFIHKNKKGVCYFCPKNSQVEHHIDMNRNNNKKENKLDLCQSCHTKLHRIYKILLKRFVP